MEPDTSRWRTLSAYQYLDTLSPGELAWEYLRRNRSYQADYARHMRDLDHGKPLPLELEQRWGLRFRR